MSAATLSGLREFLAMVEYRDWCKQGGMAGRKTVEKLRIPTL